MDIEKLRKKNYPILKEAAKRSARLYRDDLLKLVDDAFDADASIVTIPLGMAHELVHVCNFVDRVEPHLNQVSAIKVVCLCGSTKFTDTFREANRDETMAGNIVLAPGVFAHAGDPLTEDEKANLDELHFRKIDMSDEVLVLNVAGYIGSSTRNEIDYARSIGKPVRFLEPMFAD